MRPIVLKLSKKPYFSDQNATQVIIYNASGSDDAEPALP